MPGQRKKTEAGPKSRLTIAKRFAKIADMEYTHCEHCGREQEVVTLPSECIVCGGQLRENDGPAESDWRAECAAVDAEQARRGR